MEQLRDVKGAVTVSARRSLAGREIWGRPALRRYEPKSIRYPRDYSGSTNLSISCTQTELPAKQQAKLVSEWCETLPGLRRVKRIWFHSRASQELFEAACRVPQLEALYIGLSGIDDLSPLTDCENLRYLHIGGFVKLESFDPLASLSRLKWLQLGNVREMLDLKPVAALTGLKGLGISGTESKRLTLQSFEPLSALVDLEWLHLGSVSALDYSLRPFAQMRKLKFLGLPNYSPVEEFAALSLRLGPDVCKWLQPYVRFDPTCFPCRSCKQNWRVMCSGKGGRLLCPACDTVPLARHVLRFNRARHAAMSAGYPG